MAYLFQVKRLNDNDYSLWGFQREHGNDKVKFVPYHNLPKTVAETISFSDFRREADRIMPSYDPEASCFRHVSWIKIGDPSLATLFRLTFNAKLLTKRCRL